MSAAMPMHDQSGAATSASSGQPPKASAVREANKVLRAVIEDLIMQLEANLAILGRHLGEKCERCRGEIPIYNCFRCSRVKGTLDALEYARKALR